MRAQPQPQARRVIIVQKLKFPNNSNILSEYLNPVAAKFLGFSQGDVGSFH